MTEFLKALVVIAIFVAVSEMDYQDKILEQSNTAASRPLASSQQP